MKYSNEVHQPRMKVFALGLDENQKTVVEKTIDDSDVEKGKKEMLKQHPQQQQPQIVLAKAPKRRYGFSCNLFSWFIGAFCLVLLCLAISEVTYHRQRDQAFLRLKWAELRQRMLGYELLSQQQELDRMALEKSQKEKIEALPLRRSNDPIKPQIAEEDAAQASLKINDAINDNSDYKEEQNLKFGFLQDLMNKIRKHAESMGLSGDMQVHVVEVKPISTNQDVKPSIDDDRITFDRSIADGFGEFAAPHQDFGDDFDNGRITFDRHSFKKPQFFGPFNRWENNYYNDYNGYDDQQQQQQFVFRPLPNPFLMNSEYLNMDQQFENDPRYFGSIPDSRPVFYPPPPLPLVDQTNWAPYQAPMEIQTNQWNPMTNNQNPQVLWPQQQQQQSQWNSQNIMFPTSFDQQSQQQQPAQLTPNDQRPWYMSSAQNSVAAAQPAMWQNDDWMQRSEESMVPFQPNPRASDQEATKWIDQNARLDNSISQVSDGTDVAASPESSIISVDNGPVMNSEDSSNFNVKAWVQPQNDNEQQQTAPDAQLEPIDENNKFLPIRSDDKPIDLTEDPSHLFQIDDPSSFRR